MLVIDANIAVKLVTPELGRDEAYDRIQNENVLVAPDWILVEVGHALWRKVKLELLTRDAAEECLSKLPSFFQEMMSAPQSVSLAHKLAFKLDHWIYDCIYLALALNQDAILLTADRKFWNAAKRGGYGASVELLTWPGQSK